MIIKNANHLMQLMDFSPRDFVMNASDRELKMLNKFKHRTFNAEDCRFFIKALRNIYQNEGLENVFANKNRDAKQGIIQFRERMLQTEHEPRVKKHISDVLNNSAAKRLNMFLRWLVRKDNNGVDFGIWNNILMQNLYIPLDVHSGNTARKLGLLTRSQNDWKSVDELTKNLLNLNSKDPVKYDFALFGLGVFEGF